MKSKISKNIKTVLDILRDEVKGDVASALKKMDTEYSMTWMYADIDNKKLFPNTKLNLKSELEEVYPIEKRVYEIKNIAEGKNIVMVELIESYPDPETKKVYRTPLVLILEMKKGKIVTGRHYCDPRLSFKFLKAKQVEKGFKKSKGTVLTIK